MRELRREFPDAIAGEMEGTGIHEATMQGEKPDWIMVKAISDWGYGKVDDGQPTAATTWDTRDGLPRHSGVQARSTKRNRRRRATPPKSFTHLRVVPPGTMGFWCASCASSFPTR